MHTICNSQLLNSGLCAITMTICPSMRKCLRTCGDDSKGSPLPSGEGLSCFICLGEGPDENGEPLRRDCSCRGGSGYAHLSCIAAYGEQHNRRVGGCDIHELSKPWSVCPNCCQEYQGELALDLAAKFVTSLERNHPDDQSKLLEALFLKLGSMDELMGNYKAEREQVANSILSTIEQMKTQIPILPHRIFWIEARVYNEMGRTYNLEGTKEGAKRAMESFEKCRDVSEGIGDAACVAIAESNIAVMKADIDGSVASYAGWIQKQRELYEQRTENYGEGSRHTIESGLNLAVALYGADQRTDAGRLLRKLVAISNRFHGSNHRVTREVASHLRSYKIKRVTGKLKACILLILFSLVFRILQILYGPSHSPNDEEIKREIERMYFWAIIFFESILILIMLDIYANSLGLAN